MFLPDASRCIDMLTTHETSLRSCGHLVRGSSQGWKLRCMVSIGFAPRLPLKSHSCMFARFCKYLPSNTCKTWQVVCNWFAVIGCPSGYCLWYLSVCVILLYLVNARFNDTSNDETVPHLRCVSVLLVPFPSLCDTARL